MKQKSNKKSLNVGRRTVVHIAPSNKESIESFSDYWQPSNSSRDETPSPNLNKHKKFSIVSSDLDKTQTVINDTSLREELNSNKIVKTSKSAESKSRNKKCKETLMKEKKKSVIKIDAATSEVLNEISNTNKNEKISNLNSRSKTNKRKKSPISSVDCDGNKEGDSESQVRRSTRQKVAPLESWRLERRVFGYRNGDIVNLGYEKGFPDYISKHINKKQVKESKAPKPKKRPPKKAPKLSDNSFNVELIQSSVSKVCISNPNTGGEEYLYLHRPYETLLWSVPPNLDQEDPPYTCAKCVAGQMLSFGYIEIGVSKKKEEQVSPDNITFTVIKGNVKIKINKQELCLKELDKVIVPTGNGYSIKNTGKIPALLSFCIFQVPFYDYQFENCDE